MAGLVPPPPPSSSPIHSKTDEKVDYMNLPCPIPYEEIHRESFMSLKPELFEGLRFDFTKGLNQRFALSHSVFMGPTELPSQSSETIKVPTAHYEFGANFLDPKLMLVGRIMTDGRLNARVKCDLTDNLIMKANAQLTSDPHMSHGMATFDYKGTDYRTQFQLGNGSLFGASYIQSVTPHLSLGGEVFWAGQHRKSGVGYAARYNTDKMVTNAIQAHLNLDRCFYILTVIEAEMAMRGVWQLKKLVLHYCDWGGSSRGLRAFIEKDLPAFKENNPQLEIVTGVVRNKHPVLKGYFANGRDRPVSVRNLDPKTILIHANQLRNNLGKKVVELKKRHYTKHKSVQGTWSTALKF